MKKWKGDILSLYNPGTDPEVSALDLKAALVERDGETSTVEFSWQGGIPFSRVLEICGSIPIPPYLNRETETIDRERYQTLYARFRGSVAAPTAGLHFSDNVLKGLDVRGIERENVCLHVGAGTFLPVKSEAISGHTMHSEPFSISFDTLNRIYNNLGSKDVIAVGTTSVRTLESLYWLGADCALSGAADWTPSPVGQWVPYESGAKDVPVKDAFGALLEYCGRNNLDRIIDRTRIIIVPSYRYKVVTNLITNFHQPNSTLLLLIAALIGEDWRKVYAYALEHGFRFLSYGDSSLLIPRV